MNKVVLMTFAERVNLSLGSGLKLTPPILMYSYTLKVYKIIFLFKVCNTVCLFKMKWNSLESCMEFFCGIFIYCF